MKYDNATDLEYQISGLKQHLIPTKYQLFSPKGAAGYVALFFFVNNLFSSQTFVIIRLRYLVCIAINAPPTMCIKQKAFKIKAYVVRRLYLPLT